MHFLFHELDPLLCENKTAKNKHLVRFVEIHKPVTESETILCNLSFLVLHRCNTVHNFLELFFLVQFLKSLAVWTYDLWKNNMNKGGDMFDHGILCRYI